MKTEKVTQLVLKLLKMTSNNEINWNSYSVSNPDLPNGETILDKIYSTILGQGKFRVYRYKYKFWIDEEKFEWIQRIRLELIDSSGNTEFEFEYENSMNDLYEVIREQTSNVSNIIDDILGINLEIIEAKYYTNNKSLDVTQALKEKINNNKLVILASNDIGGDPEYRIVKKLKVKYDYCGEILEKEVSENEIMKLP
jgi:hypothetical protein